MRLYMMKANAPWEDTAFQKDGPKNARKVLNTLWNVVNFATTYMSLDSYEPGKHSMLDMEKYFRNEDRWMISKTERLKRDVTDNIESRNLHKAARALEDYIQEDLSRWYVRLIRDRMWTEQDDHDKLASYFVLHYSIMATIRLLAPFCPHISEEIYRNIDGTMDTIHMSDWPTYNEALIDDSLEYSMKLVQEIVEISASERQKNNVKLRWPLKRMVVAGETKIINESIASFENVLVQQANLKAVEYVEPPEIWKDMKLRVIPNPHAIGKVYRQWSSKIARLLETRPPQQVKDAVEKGTYEIGIEGQFLKIEPNMVSFSYENPESVVTSNFSGGILYLDFQITPEIEAEGYARELIRRIQQMRKDIKLDVEEYVRTEVNAPEKLVSYFKTWKQHIMKETRSRSINFSDEPQGDEVKDWEVQGQNISVAISSLKMGSTSESFGGMSFLNEKDVVALNQAGFYDLQSLQGLSHQEILSIPGP
ncbi:MAG: isoleucine--tRNA ligase, partial [Spirochaetia bacterium]|nr:isoleucine--tRNA ligase [Spirochaetia bacterium]